MERIDIDIRKKLNNFDLNINIHSSAKKIGILGESGAGKSMTLKCIAGIEECDTGFICIDGIKLYDPDGKINLKPQDRHAGYMFQNYALFPTMTVYENVEAGTFKNNPEIKNILNKFNISELSNVYPDKLSGGQKQRVALARILIGKPRIIMLDEPFSALDNTLKDRMQQELSTYLEEYDGIVIMVSHNRDEIYRFSDEIFVIKDGNIIESGKTGDIFLKPRKKETARLTGCKNITEIERLNDNNAVAPKWNLNIRTEHAIPEYSGYIGYRAHDFAPKGEKGQVEEYNTINVLPRNIAHLPFETNLYYEIENTNEQISYFVSREEYEQFLKDGVPKALMLKEEKMLFLED